MQIIDNIQNLINRYNQSSTQNVLEEIKPILRDSIVGQEIRGEILKIMAESALILLDDGSQITVAGNVPSNAKEGQIMNIEVEGKNKQGIIKAKVISIEEPEINKMTTIKSCFKDLNIAMSEENLQIAKQMIKEHIDITPNNIKFIFEQCLKTNKLNSEEVIFLLKNGIDVNEENVEIFLNFVTKENFIADNLNSIIENINTLKLDGNEKTINIKADTSEKNSLQEIAKNSQGIQIENKSYNKAGNYDDNKNFVDNEINIEESNILDDKIDTKIADNKTNTLQDGVLVNEDTKKYNVEVNQNNDDIFDFDEKDDNLARKSANQEGINVLNKDDLKIATKETMLPKHKREILANKQNQLENIFKNLVTKKNPGKEIEQKKIIREVMKTLYEKENFESKNLLDADTSKNIDKLRKNIVFLNSINKYNNAFQIPLNINNERTVAELYVFNGDSNKSDKRINENNFTMFFTLGTANLGNVEAYVRVINKTVECNFVSSKSDVAQLIDDNKEELINMTNAYGFKMIKVTSAIGKKDINLLSAINENKKNIEKNNFDIKV